MTMQRLPFALHLLYCLSIVHYFSAAVRGDAVVQYYNPNGNFLLGISSRHGYNKVNYFDRAMEEGDTIKAIHILDIGKKELPPLFKCPSRHGDYLSPQNTKPPKSDKAIFRGDSSPPIKRCKPAAFYLLPIANSLYALQAAKLSREVRPDDHVYACPSKRVEVNELIVKFQPKKGCFRVTYSSNNGGTFLGTRVSTSTFPTMLGKQEPHSELSLQLQVIKADARYVLLMSQTFAVDEIPRYRHFPQIKVRVSVGETSDEVRSKMYPWKKANHKYRLIANDAVGSFEFDELNVWYRITAVSTDGEKQNVYVCGTGSIMFLEVNTSSQCELLFYHMTDKEFYLMYKEKQHGAERYKHKVYVPMQQENSQHIRLTKSKHPNEEYY